MRNLILILQGVVLLSPALVVGMAIVLLSREPTIRAIMTGMDVGLTLLLLTGTLIAWTQAKIDQLFRR